MESRHRLGMLQLTAEGAIRNQTGHTEIGGYVETLWRTTPNHHLALRADLFDLYDSQSQKTLSLCYNYRPHPAASFKLEYRAVDTANDLILASAAVMF